VKSDEEYNELALQAFSVAQNQFLLGCETGAVQERQRIIRYLIEKDVIRESMLQGWSDTPLYVGMRTDASEGVDLSFEKQKPIYQMEGTQWRTS
jgi:hypothetical protein